MLNLSIYELTSSHKPAIVIVFIIVNINFYYHDSLFIITFVRACECVCIQYYYFNIANCSRWKCFIFAELDCNLLKHMIGPNEKFHILNLLTIAYIVCCGTQWITRV